MADPVYRLMGVPEGTFRGRQPMVGRLVGRRRELEQLRAAWTQACGGQRRWWIVRGEPGIGKSRLLQEFSCGLRAQGARCLELAGHEQAMQSPFAAMLDGLQRQLGTERVCTPHADQRRWGDALLSTLTALAGEEPLCVLADDVQWLDASTLDLLRRLWGSREGARLLFVWGERTTDTGAGRAPPEAQALDLRGLDDREAAELVDQLDHPLPAAARRRVIERAGGVPLYLEECLRASSRELSIAEEDVPATLEDLLMVRLGEPGPRSCAGATAVGAGA